MEVIVTQIMEDVTKNLITKASEGKNMAELEKILEVDLKKLGRILLSEIVQEVDCILQCDPIRKKTWQIERKNQRKTIATKFGDVTFERTYFKNKISGEYAYLADVHFGLTSHQRLSENVQTEILENVVDLSYEKSCKRACGMSRQTAKNLVHNTNNKLLKVLPIPPKTRIERLYISADEDHVAMQDGSNKMQYLVYVYEGWNADGSLKNVRYFTQKQGNHEDFWANEIAVYVYEAYDMDFCKEIFLSGDGARWIKAGLEWFPGAKWVIDKFHLAKYIKKGSAWAICDTFNPSMEIWQSIDMCDKKAFSTVCDRLLTLANDDKKFERVNDMRKYILNNWKGVENLKNPHFRGCSAEGHVSHILSARLSSRPKGWSLTGMDNVANLRTFVANGGEVGCVVKTQIAEKQKIRKLEITANIQKNLQKHRNVDLTGIKIPYLTRCEKSPIYSCLRQICYGWLNVG